MSRPAPILQVAIQPPKSIMGLKPNAYRMCDMERILSHYQRAFPYKRNKDATLSQLRQLEQELSLTRHDRLRILQPFRDGNRTNIRKHTVRKSSAHRTTVPVAAQGANDGMAVAIKPVATVKVKEEGVGATRLPTVFIDHHDDTSSQKICCICTEELSSNSFPPRSVTDACSHASNACFACVQRSIEVQIQRLFWKSIGCPVCNVPLEYKDVRDFGSRAIFERYDSLCTAEAVSKLPNFRRCLTRGCNSGQVHELGEAEPILTCNGCGNRTCFIHEMDWHDGLTCLEFDQKLAETKNIETEASEALLKRETKSCPNESCNKRIWKNGGCQHMTCSQCRHQFCWDCLVSWPTVQQHGNDGHAKTCPWYSHNVPIHPFDTARLAAVQQRRLV